MRELGAVDAVRAGLPTLFLVAVYFLVINWIGARLGRRQKDARDYFLGSRAMPWPAVMGSIVATETSALTFLSVPGDAYTSGYLFLQLVLGYVVGRIAVAALLLPGYFEREIPTAYALLESRFGPRARRVTSLLFLTTRVLAAAVRLAVPAIPIALILRVPVWTAVLLLAAGTALYTLLGGIRAVIWIDLIQVFLYLSGALLALGFLLARLPGGLPAALAARAAAGDPVRFFDARFDPALPYTLWSGIVGGAFLSMASHGADQLIVQRLLACRTLSGARKAIVGSGFLVLGQMALFTTLGVLLRAYFAGRQVGGGAPGAFRSPDEIFPAFVVGHLPPLVSAYLVAGVFSAAMCSESSALNSLASSLSADLVAPFAGREAVEGRRGLVLGRELTLLWSVVLALLAVGFSYLPASEPAVQVALGLASVTAGGLLGAFVLARFAPRVSEGDVLLGIAASTVLVFALWLGAHGFLPLPLARRIAWPWYSLVGCAIACSAAGLSRAARRASGAAR